MGICYSKNILTQDNAYRSSPMPPISPVSPVIIYNYNIDESNIVYIHDDDESE